MNRMSNFLILLFAASVTGCFWVRDHEVKWVEETSRSELIGLGAEDSEKLHWEKNLRDVDTGRRVSIGLIPGAASLNAGWLTKDDKTKEVKKLDAGTWVFGTLIGQAFALCTPTISSLFFEPFMEPNKVGLNVPMSYWSWMGCHRWQVSETSEIVERGEAEDSIVAKIGSRTVSGNREYGKAAEGIRLYYEYPGFDVLWTEADARGSVAVAYPYAEGLSSFLYRKYMKSAHNDHALVYKNVSVGDDEVARAQLRYYNGSRKLLGQMRALRSHEGYSIASNAIPHVAELENKIRAEMRENEIVRITDAETSLSTMSNAIVKLGQSLNSEYKAYVDARIAKAKAACERIDAQLPGLMQENIARAEKETATCCEPDLCYQDLIRQCELGVKGPDAKIWEQTLGRVREARNTCSFKLKHLYVEQLIAAQKYDDAIARCHDEVNEFANRYNVEWKKLIDRAEEEKVAKLKGSLDALMAAGKYASLVSQCEEILEGLQCEKNKQTIRGYTVLAESKIKEKEIERQRQVAEQEAERQKKFKASYDDLLAKKEWSAAIGLCVEAKAALKDRKDLVGLWQIRQERTCALRDADIRAKKIAAAEAYLKQKNLADIDDFPPKSPKRNTLYHYTGEIVPCKISSFISKENDSFSGALNRLLTESLSEGISEVDDTTKIIIRCGRTYCICLTESSRKYVDDDDLESCWLTYMGIENFVGSRIHCFLEMPMTQELKDSFASLEKYKYEDERKKLRNSMVLDGSMLDGSIGLATVIKSGRDTKGRAYWHEKGLWVHKVLPNGVILVRDEDSNLAILETDGTYSRGDVLAKGWFVRLGTKCGIPLFSRIDGGYSEP